MSIDYTGNPAVYHTTITLPEDGEPQTVASVTDPLKDLLDNCAYNKALKHVATGVKKWLERVTWQKNGATDASKEHFVPLRAAGDKGGWAANHATGGDADERLVFDVDLPHNSTITQVEVYIDPGHSHPSLPSSMPRWELQAHSPPGNISVLDSQTDTSGNVAAYEAAHTIAKASLSHTLNLDTTRYQIVLFCEGGASSQSGFRVEGCRVTFNTTHVDERAA